MTMKRREFLIAGTLAAAATESSPPWGQAPTPAVAAGQRAAGQARIVTLDAKPGTIAIDTAKTAILVIDMQNDFGAKGGLMERAAIDISMIQRAVGPTVKTVAAGRNAGLNIVYLKMAFKPDLSDMGADGSPNRVRHLAFGVGRTVSAPDGTPSRILIRDTWNTDILPELTPQPGDTVLYKHRYSGFFQTDLDAILKQLGVKYLIVTGCTTSVCVESTMRDAMFRDYACVLLGDCTGEPIGYDLPRSNHEASLLLMQGFGWVSDSKEFVKVIEAPQTAAGKA